MNNQFLGLYTIVCDRLLLFHKTEISFSVILAELIKMQLFGLFTFPKLEHPYKHI